MKSFGRLVSWLPQNYYFDGKSDCGTHMCHLKPFACICISMWCNTTYPFEGVERCSFCICFLNVEGTKGRLWVISNPAEFKSMHGCHTQVQAQIQKNSFSGDRYWLDGRAEKLELNSIKFEERQKCFYIQVQIIPQDYERKNLINGIRGCEFKFPFFFLNFTSFMVKSKREKFF